MLQQERAEALDLVVDAILAENGLDADDASQLILRRDIASNGKSRVFVNNQPATVAVFCRRFRRSLSTRDCECTYGGPAPSSNIDST